MVNKFLTSIITLMIAFGFLLSGKFAWDNPSLRQEFMLELNVLAGVVKTLNEGKDDKEDKDDTKPKRRR